MKKPFAAFIVFMSAALPAFCASTCETRVDKHQDATTTERVSYCLTPEEELAPAAGPELVYYGVSSNEPQFEEEESSAYKQKYLKRKDFAVAQDFVGTHQFPEFENDTLSERERIEREEAARAAREKAREEARKKAQAAREAKEAAAAEAEEKEPVMSKAQLAARKNKPKRFMKETEEEAASYAPDSYGADPYSAGAPQGELQQEELAPAAQNVSSDAALYETGTPQGELQNVQALNNDPSVQPTGNAGGAAPDGFLDDNLMAEDPSFGYNATDPAMQP